MTSSKLVKFCKKNAYNSEPNEETLEWLHFHLETEFSDAPFYIAYSMERLIKLDERFTNEPVIIIKDGRVNDVNFHYRHINDGHLKFTDYVVIKKQGNKPITLRQIINTLIWDKHYRNMFICSDPHYFFTDLEKSENSDIQYTAIFEA